METQIIQTEGEIFIVNFIKSPNTTFSYYGEVHLEQIGKHMFDFSFCWRGVWEGRIYFKQEEYWSEELSDMSDVWDKIEQIMKDKIKVANNDYKQFD